MFSKKHFSRLLPFFATFLVGVFVASFFVTLGGGRSYNDRRARHLQHDQQMQLENDQLREENFRLKRHHHCDRLGRMYGESPDSDSDVRDLLPPPPPLPARPVAPSAIK